MINLNVIELIQRLDKLLKAKLQAKLLNSDIPYEQFSDALERGFEEGETQWEADLKKYDPEVAKVLREGLKI